MDKTFIKKINEFATLTRLSLYGENPIISNPLVLKKVDDKVKTLEQAKEVFRNLSFENFDENQILRRVPHPNFSPGPSWILSFAYMVPYGDLGWIFVFEGGNEIGFLSNLIFSIKDEDIQTSFNRKEYFWLTLIITVISIISFVSGFYLFRI